MHPPITLRPVSPDDEPFLYSVYAGTREDELAPLGWDEARKKQFLRMQFNAQHRFYRDQFPTADFQIIMSGAQAIGRLYVDRREDEIRIVDIALLPEHRSAGVGGALMGDLLAEAARDRKPVRIHVERHNRALRLYERLGFVRIGDNGVYYLMEWSADGSPEMS
jgi:ribosomal protein S18 acetylase RimI-like enzyme